MANFEISMTFMNKEIENVGGSVDLPKSQHFFLNLEMSLIKVML